MLTREDRRDLGWLGLLVAVYGLAFAPVLHAVFGYRGSWYEVNMGVQNLLNTQWREAQFANVSRLPFESSCPEGTRPAGEAGAFEGCEDLHFTPGAPLNIQASASLFFH